MGHSNGGQMALYLACRTDIIRGPCLCLSSFSSYYVYMPSFGYTRHHTPRPPTHQPTQRSSCPLSPSTTGLVSIAGFGLPPGCRVPRPCTALIAHGTEDLVVPYDLSTQVRRKHLVVVYA